MAKPFSIRDLIDNDAWQGNPESDVYEKVSIHDIGLNPKNEYTISEIEKLKDSIYALGGVQQNVVLVKCPEWSAHRYLALDGHRRLMACRQLVNEGYPEFECVPAVIKANLDADTEEAMLVMINSTQRNKSDWEKVMEHMKLKEIIPKIKKRQGADGRTRDIEADMLGVSRGQISIYNTIGTRLITELMQLLRQGDIGITLAHAAAQMEPGMQRELVRLAAETGSFNEEDIKMLIDRRPLKGQLIIESEADENVPVSGTSGKEAKKLVSTQSVDGKNVPVSGTFEEPGRAQVEKSQQEAKVCPADDECEVAVMDFMSGKIQEDPGEDNMKDQEVALRGGYTLVLVRQQIQKYAGYLDMAVKNNRLNMVSEYRCLLDALDLLDVELVKNGCGKGSRENQ